MKKFALVMTSNLLYKNEFIDNLIEQNKDSINYLIKLDFKSKNQTALNHYYKYFLILGFKGLFHVLKLRMLYLLKFVFKNKSNKLITFDDISKKHNVPMMTIKSVNSSEFINFINTQDIDYVINSGNQIYSKNTLSKINAKIVNRHTSLLPLYGGIYPIYWQMLHEETKSGVTLHWIDEHIDRGQIAYQEEFPIDKNNSLFDNYKIAFDISLDLCNQLIEDLNKNIIISDKIISKGSYYSWPTNHDSRLFKSKNLKIV